MASAAAKLVAVRLVGLVRGPAEVLVVEVVSVAEVVMAIAAVTVTVGVRVVMMVLRVVSGSRVVRVVMIAGVRDATIAVETVGVPAATIGGSSMTRRRMLRNNVGRKSSPARVRANTAKTNRLLTARTVPSMWWTKVRFEESDSTLRNKNQQNVVLLAIGEAHRFPRPQRSKSRWRARFARRSVIVASTT